MPKVKLKADIYKILSRAVEEGIAYGWNRAHKFTDKPNEETIKDEIEKAVMNEICEVIKLDP
jgi:hypothetical protein